MCFRTLLVSSRSVCRLLYDIGMTVVRSSRPSLGCNSYSVPEHVREHIDIIQPTVHFLHRVPRSDMNLRKRSTPEFGKIEAAIMSGPKTNGQQVTITPGLENCDKQITLDCLRALYSVDYTPQSTDKNTFGICKRLSISKLKRADSTCFQWS